MSFDRLLGSALLGLGIGAIARDQGWSFWPSLALAVAIILLTAPQGECK